MSDLETPTVQETEISDTSENNDSSENADSTATAVEEPKKFKMDVNDTPFAMLKGAHESGNEAQFNTMVAAMQMMYGGLTAEIVKDGFHAGLRGVKAKTEIVKYDKRLVGHTFTNALISLLKDGHVIAKDGGGTVGFTLAFIEAEKEGEADKVVIKSLFRGIDGVSSAAGNRGGARGRFQYFDKGTVIKTSLKKYILTNYASSQAGLLITSYETKSGNISAWEAVKKDDSLSITRSEKKIVTGDDSSK